MGRNNADFQKQVLLHRGLTGITPEEVDTENLGEHWSTDEGVAKEFAGSAGAGVVVTALVPKKDTLEGEWETRRRDWLKTPEAFDPEDDYSGPDPEKEVRVHPRSKPTVVKITEVK